MLSGLYSFLTILLKPYFIWLLKKRIKTGKEHETRYPERMGISKLKRPSGRLVWCHGASVGESLSMLPIIEDILKHDQNMNVLVTTGTVTSAKLMEDRLPDRAFHQFIPMDRKDWTERFLEHWLPDMVIWLESDFWPNLLKGIKKRQIPSILVNARMSEASFDKWRMGAKGFLKTLLSTFDTCLAQNDAEKKRLEAFGHENVHITSNLKYASKPLPTPADKVAELKTALGGRPCWQFASTHPGEEEQAARVHKALKMENPDALTIIVPRHPERGDEIKKMLEEDGLQVTQRSKGEEITSDTDIYVADTLGELGVFFEVVKLVVMGGSFVPHGGHNPIEPAQLGCGIIYGPHMFNFKTICYDFESHGACMIAKDSQDLTGMLKRLISASGEVQNLGQVAKTMTEDKATARQEVWAHIHAMVANL